MRVRAAPGCSGDRHRPPGDESRSCGEARAASAAAARRGRSARDRIRRTSEPHSARPRTLTNRRSLRSACSSVRPRSTQRSSASAAARPTGTMRCLSPLPVHPQRPLVAVEVAQAQAAQLGCAQPAPVQRLQHRPVAQRDRRVGVGAPCVQQLARLPPAEGRRQRARALRPGHERGRVALRAAADEQPGVQAAHRRELAPGGGWRVAQRAQVGGVAADDRHVGVLGSAAGGGQPAAVLVEVGAVGAQGRRRGTGSAQMVEVRVDAGAGRSGL